MNFGMCLDLVNCTKCFWSVKGVFSRQIMKIGLSHWKPTRPVMHCTALIMYSNVTRGHLAVAAFVSQTRSTRQSVAIRRRVNDATGRHWVRSKRRHNSIVISNGNDQHIIIKQWNGWRLIYKWIKYVAEKNYIGLDKTLITVFIDLLLKSFCHFCLFLSVW